MFKNVIYLHYIVYRISIFLTLFLQVKLYNATPAWALMTRTATARAPKSVLATQTHVPLSEATAVSYTV